MARRPTAKDIAKRTTMKLVKKISESVDQFCAGDDTAAITSDEAKFLQDVIKLEQEAEQGEAVVAYLQDMETDELEAYHERLKKSLEEENGLN